MKTKLIGLAIALGLVAQPYAFAQDSGSTQQEESGDAAGSDTAAGGGVDGEAVAWAAGGTALAIGVLSVINDDNDNRALPGPGPGPCPGPGPASCLVRLGGN